MTDLEATYVAFWDELEKISMEIPEGVRQQMADAEFEAKRQAQQPMQGAERPQTIRRGMIGNLIRYGVPAAAAVGVGYGTSRLVSEPVSRWLQGRGVGPKATTFLRYALPIGAGLGAGYTLVGNKLTDELAKKVSGDND